MRHLHAKRGMRQRVPPRPARVPERHRRHQPPQRRRRDGRRGVPGGRGDDRRAHRLERRDSHLFANRRVRRHGEPRDARAAHRAHQVHRGSRRGVAVRGAQLRREVLDLPRLSQLEEALRVYFALAVRPRRRALAPRRRARRRRTGARTSTPRRLYRRSSPLSGASVSRTATSSPSRARRWIPPRRRPSRPSVNPRYFSPPAARPRLLEPRDARARRALPLLSTRALDPSPSRASPGRRSSTLDARVAAARLSF